MKKVIAIALLFVQSYLVFGQEITLDDIYKKGTFRGEAVSGFKSMNDGKHYTAVEKGNIVKYGFKDGKLKGIIADTNNLRINNQPINFDDYEFSNDEQKILLMAEGDFIYRHSANYNVYLFDTKTKTAQKIGNEKIMHATLSPDAQKVAFVKDNNLFIYDVASSVTTAITKDGKWNHIINGNCDWVYEEEFGFTKAFEWSNDSKYLAFYKFDESKVKEYSFSIYDSLYPKEYRYKYPKAGEDNSKVGIYIYNSDGKSISKADIGNDEDIYIPRIKYSKYDNRLLIYKLNRLQNKLTVFGIMPGETESQLVYNEDNNKYIDIRDDIQFLTKNNAFFYVSEKNGYNHIWLFDMNNGGDAQITKGNWEVVSLLAVDEQKKQLFFTSTESSPLERKLYRCDFDGKNKICLTPEPGTHSISASNNMQFFMDVHSSINSPATYSIKDNTGKTLRILKDNAALKAKMASYNLPKQELITIPNGEGDSLYGWILKPSNWNDGNKHPLLMYQYSGPGSQEVSNKWIGRDYWWYQMLAQKGYIIAVVDGRGTGFRGEAFKKCTYLQLGKLESDDQIAAAKYLGQLSYVDSKRIGIWGWSYGGFMSSICLAKGADVFKCAMAVAPVTNWRYYDNIYTERYMRKPQDNAAGYDDNSPVNMVKKIKGNYLLIHGSADDNVHYQNTMEMIDAMLKAGVEFDSEIYPDQNHSIPASRYHLYNRLTKFIMANL